MSFEDQITEYGTAKYGKEGTTNESLAAEIAPETPVEPAIIPEANAEIAEPAPVAPTPVEPIPSAPDYNAIFEEISGGVIKDVESFKSSLPKLQEYDSLVASKSELEGKVANMFTPANDYVKALNEMMINGATTDQIKSFVKLNEVGDLSQLSPTDIKVHKLVHEGYAEEIARKIVAQEFPLNDFDEGSDERTILEEKLKISSAKDLKELEQHKKDLSSFGENKNQELEQQKLAVIATEEAHKKEVKLAVPKIAEALTGLGEKVLIEASENTEPIKINFNYSDEFKKDVPQLLNDFFVNYKLPVTAENIEKANQYVSAVYWDANRDTLLQAAAKHVEAVTWEKATNKYENRSGLPAEPVNANVVNTNAQRADFLNSVANRQASN